jgi:hypothetical protein
MPQQANTLIGAFNKFDPPLQMGTDVSAISLTRTSHPTFPPLPKWQRVMRLQALSTKYRRTVLWEVSSKGTQEQGGG